MKPSEFAREVAFPATTPSVLFALVLFFGLFQFAFVPQPFGMVGVLLLAALLIVFVLPALLRTLMALLEARSQGMDPDPPAIESFSWVSNFWSLFPIVHLAIFVYAFYFAGSLVNGAVAYSIAVVYALFLPASLVVLSVTHSALESLTPGAIIGLIRRCGAAYLTGPLFLIAALGIVIWLNGRFNKDLLTEFVSFYLTFASFAVFGGMVRSLKLQNELEIPEAAEPCEEDIREQQLMARNAALNHAYGMVSRGNRAGGLEHLYSELDVDPDNAASFAWYFGRIMQWENKDAALVFAQQYLHYLLHDGDNIAAVKVMLRCRLINDAFKPQADDIPLALAAAEQCHNDELASFLR